MTHGSRILGLIVRLTGVCLISVIALAFAFELYLRHTGFLKTQPANYPCMYGDPVLNHVFQQNCKEVAFASALKTAHDATYITNERGYRGHIPVAGKRLIVAIGDSYTEGFGLEEQDSFPSMLERALAERGRPNWQVLNGGTMGFSTVLYPFYFDRFFLLDRPELVLLNLDVSDFTDEPYLLVIAGYDALNQPVSFPGREALPSWIAAMAYSNHSALFRFFHQEINIWNLERIREEVRWRMDKWIYERPPLIPEAALREVNLQLCWKSIEAVAKNILVLKAHAAAAGAKFVVHMYPPGYFVKSRPLEPQSISFLRAWEAKHRSDTSWDCGISPAIVGIMKDFAERNGIPFVDSFPLIDAQPDRDSLYFEHDAHWNEKGVKLVTEEVAKRIMPLLAPVRKKSPQ